MSKSEKDNFAPPTYDEAMYASTNPPSGAPPQIGIIYPNANSVHVGIHQMPTAPQAHVHVPSYGAFETTPVSVVLQQPAVTMPSDIIVIGGCPACRIGYLEDAYPCIALLCAIAFFPIGILCCLAMKTKRCSHCSAEF